MNGETNVSFFSSLGISDLELRKKTLHSLVLSLPIGNLNCLRLLMRLLFKIHQLSHRNLMNATNLVNFFFSSPRNSEDNLILFIQVLYHRLFGWQRQLSSHRLSFDRVWRPWNESFKMLLPATKWSLFLFWRKMSINRFVFSWTHHSVNVKWTTPTIW